MVITVEAARCTRAKTRTSLSQSEFRSVLTVPGFVGAWDTLGALKRPKPLGSREGWRVGDPCPSPNAADLRAIFEMLTTWGAFRCSYGPPVGRWTPNVPIQHSNFGELRVQDPTLGPRNGISQLKNAQLTLQ